MKITHVLNIVTVVLIVVLLLYIANLNNVAYVKSDDVVDLDGIKQSWRQDIQSLNASRAEFEEYMNASMADIARLRQELDSTKHRMLKQAQENQGATNAQHPGAQLASVEVSEANSDASASHLDEALLTQEVDVNWSSQAEKEIVSKLDVAELSDMEIVNLECRTTLCKIDINLSSSMSMMDTFRKLHQSVALEGSSLVEISQDGSNALIYVAREGFDLPN